MNERGFIPAPKPNLPLHRVAHDILHKIVLEAAKRQRRHQCASAVMANLVPVDGSEMSLASISRPAE
jgi:hypothetical protein